MENENIQNGETKTPQPKKKKNKVLYWGVIVLGSAFIFAGSMNIGYKLAELNEPKDTVIEEKEESNVNESVDETKEDTATNTDSNSNENTSNSNVSNNNTSNTGNKNEVATQSADERYKTYLANLEKDVKATCTTNHPCVELDGNSLRFSVELKGNLDLYVKYQNDEKAIEKLVAKNVVQFYILENGNSGEKAIYYITKDGSIYVADDFMYETSPEKVESTKLNYKNIVSMQPAKTKPQQNGGGAAKPYFIDIDGKIHS